MSSFIIPGLPNTGGVSSFNKVEKTPSGHQFETDDTAGNERIKRSHAKGTFEEWDATGGRTMVVNGENYSAVVGNDTITIEGDCTVVVTGNCFLDVGKHLSAKSQTMYFEASQSINFKAGSNISMEASNDLNLNSGQNYNLTVTGEASERFQSSLDTNVNQNNDLTVGVDSKTQIGGNSIQYTEGGTNIVSGLDMMIGSGSATALTGGDGGIGFATSGSTIFNGADLTIESGPVSIVEALDTDSTITSVGAIHSNDDVTASSISLTGHRHGSSPLPS